MSSFSSKGSLPEPKRKRVLIVGAGAAGCACADQLSSRPDLFDVTLVESSGHCGGQAFSIPVDSARFGTSWLNQGVQGGSHVYHHVIHMMAKQNVAPTPVDLSFSFGKGDLFWTNLFPTEFVRDHEEDIKRFRSALTVMSRLSWIFGFMPVKHSLRLFRFTEDFIERMVFPTLSLWFGTGNTTPDVPTSMLILFYTDPNCGMWHPIDNRNLSSKLPEMLVFPNMSEFYNRWQASLEQRNVRIRLSARLTSVVNRSSKGVTVKLVKIRSRSVGHLAVPTEDEKSPCESEEDYDEIVFCILADAALEVLGSQATWLERKVLGAAKFSNDSTVTHCDTEYMRKHYHVEYTPELDVLRVDEPSDEEKRSKSFHPMYLVRHDAKEPKKIEMSFNCSQFQPQLKSRNLRIEDQIFQTVFLNDENKASWTKNEIQPEKIIRVDEFHQVRQGWRHFFRVVPGLALIQSHKRHTHYAGAWSLVNAHEVAVVSGLAAAYALGAGYPAELARDPWAHASFEGYLAVAYRLWGNAVKLPSSKRRRDPSSHSRFLQAPLASKSAKKSGHSSSATL
ncbi:hypothetical protein JCM11491_005433 [Sporobolomyces phaffii]